MCVCERERERERDMHALEEGELRFLQLLKFELAGFINLKEMRILYQKFPCSLK